MKKSKGFTLAEILIAMTVLGIIVAASVPVILNMRPNKNAIMMKKAYYATETIINGLINDSYYYPETDDAATEGFKNTVQVKVEGIDTTSAHKLACLFASKLNIKEDLANVCNGTIEEISTMDGMVWDLQALPENGTASGYLRIDVDGPSKGINTFFIANASDTSCLSEHTIYNWAGGSNCGSKTEKARKNFDRMLIEINSNGRLRINCTHQSELCAIISGEKSMFKDDED